MKKNFWNIASIIFVIIVFIFTIYMILKDGTENFVSMISNIEYSWIIIGLIATVIYWVLEGMCFHVITKKLYPKQKFYSCFRLAVIGRFFNNITPMSAGDQPMQLMIMKNEGKTISDGASILLTRFIVYQIILVLYTIVIMLFKYTYFADMIDNLMFFAMIGFIFNIIVVLFLITIVINKTLISKLSEYCIRLLNKIKIIKNPEKKIEKINETIDEFQEQFKQMKNEKVIIAKVAIYTIIEITVLYSLNYIVYRALGNNIESFWTIISAQAILAMVTVYMPTPGAALAAEGGFYIIYSSYFESSVIPIAVLLWRIYTFYLPIVVGMIIFFIKPKNINIQENNTNKIDA